MSLRRRWFTGLTGLKVATDLALTRCNVRAFWIEKLHPALHEMDTIRGHGVRHSEKDRTYQPVMNGQVACSSFAA